MLLVKDSALIHKGKAKPVRTRLHIRTIDNWPPSSPDINVIEKVWRWMKNRISQLEPFPLTLEALKAVILNLWDEMDPCWFIKDIESTQGRLQEVIKQRGFATKY